MKRIGRRQFLKNTASAAAVMGFPYIVPSSALGLDGAVAPSNRIVMGFIGVGGRQRHRRHAGFPPKAAGTGRRRLRRRCKTP